MLVEGKEVEQQQEGLPQSSLRRRALPSHHRPPLRRHLLRATLTPGAPSTRRSWQTWAWSGAGGTAVGPRRFRRRRRRRRALPAREAEEVEEVSTAAPAATAATAKQQTRLLIPHSLLPLRPPRPSPGATASLPPFLEKNEKKKTVRDDDDDTFFSNTFSFFSFSARNHFKKL